MSVSDRLGACLLCGARSDHDQDICAERVVARWRPTGLIKPVEAARLVNRDRIDQGDDQ